MINSQVPLFINENLETENFITGAEAHHASAVLRLREGTKIQITNGKGKLIKAVVTNISKNRIDYSVNEICELPKLSYNLHLAVAPTKNIERYEFMIEKCTEFGFSALTPVICEHSERSIVKADRLNRIVIAAAKQSLKAYFPVINESCKLKEFILQHKNIEKKYIAVCNFDDRISVNEVAELHKDTIVLIGPEGDFSNSEVDFAIESGFIPVTLGSSRLRTETAGIAVCHSFYLKSC